MSDKKRRLFLLKEATQSMETAIMQLTILVNMYDDQDGPFPGVHPKVGYRNAKDQLNQLKRFFEQGHV